MNDLGCFQTDISDHAREALQRPNAAEQMLVARAIYRLRLVPELVSCQSLALALYIISLGKM